MLTGIGPSVLVALGVAHAAVPPVGTDPFGNGCSSACGVWISSTFEADSDCDGWLDDDDKCPFDVDDTNADTDSDGLGDACDACPGDALNDSDSDTVCDGSDNCVGTANSDQANHDTDTFGDACDDDDDNDGYLDVDDLLCPTEAEDDVEFSDVSDGCPADCTMGDFDDVWNGKPGKAPPAQPNNVANVQTDGDWAYQSIIGSTYTDLQFTGPVLVSGSTTVAGWRKSSASTSFPRIARVEPTGAAVVLNANQRYDVAPWVNMMPGDAEPVSATFIATEEGLHDFEYEFLPARTGSGGTTANAAVVLFNAQNPTGLVLDGTLTNSAPASTTSNVRGYFATPDSTVSGVESLYLLDGDVVAFVVTSNGGTGGSDPVLLDAQVYSTCP